MSAIAPEVNHRSLLILDLDETLWHGAEALDGVSFLLRPHLGEFLRTVSEQYDLAVWTSATDYWMHAGLKVSHEHTGFDFAQAAFFLWSRSRCTLRRSEDGLGYEWRKPARKLRAPWIRARYPRERILAVDDTPGKWACGYGHVVRVREWTGDVQDDELPLLAAYLASIAGEPDLTRLEKRGWRSTASLHTFP